MPPGTGCYWKARPRQRERLSMDVTGVGSRRPAGPVEDRQPVGAMPPVAGRSKAMVRPTVRAVGTDRSPRG